MDFVEIKIPFSEITSNAQIQTLAVKAILGGAKAVGTIGGLTTYSAISNNDNTYQILTYSVVAYIVSLGGQVLNYQSFIEVDLTDDVPSYIRDFETISLDEVVVNLTWQDWIHANSNTITIDSKTYISGYSHYAGFRSSEKPQKHLNGTELSALIADGYNVLNKVEFEILNTD
jgi:hypothetical protein